MFKQFKQCSILNLNIKSEKSVSGMNDTNAPSVFIGITLSSFCAVYFMFKSKKYLYKLKYI